MKKLLTLTAIFIIAQIKVNAQGCVAVRQMGGIGAMCSSSSYHLDKGDIQVGANYRYFHSWRHYVGTEEQKQRQALGNAVNIFSHAIDFNISYGITNRLQLNLTIPYVHNERSQTLTMNKDSVSKALTRYSVYAHGLADVRFGLNYWVTDPAKAHTGNLMIGFGIKLATGKHNTVDDALQKDGTTKSSVNDQAIQPGDGGVGFSIEFQGFTKIYKSIMGFANGYYLFNPKESNGTYKSAPSSTPGLAGYELYACPDQYFIRGGFMTSVLKGKNLTFSLAARMEGIPAYDVLGGQVAYRRPGYVVAVEPGVTFQKKQHTISLFVPFNFIRNRIQSAADIAQQNIKNSGVTDPAKLVHVQGDAAFADHSISLGYTYRFSTSKKKH